MAEIKGEGPTRRRVLLDDGRHRLSMAVLAVVLLTGLVGTTPNPAEAQGICAGDLIEMEVGDVLIYHGFSLVNPNPDLELEDRYLEVRADAGVIAKVVDPHPDNVRQSPRFDLAPSQTVPIPVQFAALEVGTFGVRALQKEDNRFRPDPTDRELCVVVESALVTSTTTAPPPTPPPPSLSTTTDPSTTTVPGTGSTTPGTTIPGTGSTVPGTGSTTPGTGTTIPGTGSTVPGTGSTTTTSATVVTRPAIESPRGAAAAIAAPGVAAASDPVQVSTGNFTDSTVDLAFGGSVFAMDLVRSYNSVSTDDAVLRSSGLSALGRGWRLSYQSVAFERGDRSVAVTLPSGRELVFLPDGDGYERPADFGGELGRAGAGFVLATFNGDRLTYDGVGRLREARSAAGPTVTVSYDDDDRLTRVDSSVGLNVRFAHDGNGRIIEARSYDGDQFDRAVTYAYDSDGDLRSVAGADGAVTTYETDDRGRLLRIVDPTGVVKVDNAYDDRGRVVAQTTASGETTTFDYGARSTTVAVTGDDGTAPRTDTYSYTWDDRGYSTGLADPLGRSVSYQRDAAGNPVASTSRRGQDTGSSVERTFDEFGNLLTETRPGVGTSTYAYTYSAVGRDGETIALHRLASVTAPNGAVTSFTYDGTDVVPRLVEGPEGQRITNTVVDGLVQASVDGDGVRTEFGYDRLRRLVSVTDGLGQTTSFGHDGAGRMVALTDPKGQTTSLAYDPAGRLLSVTDPTGATTTRIYDDAGRLTSFADALDGVGGISARAEFAYDEAGVLASATDQRGNTSTFQTNAFGQRVAAGQPGGAEWTFEFAEMGRLVGARDPEGVGRASLGYDIDGAVAELTAADGASASFRYDIADRPVEVVDANGIRTTFDYDNTGGGLLRSRTMAAGTPDEVTVTYRYDDAYRLVEIGGPRADQVRRFTYTRGGRLDSATNANGHTVTYRYDEAGRVDQVVLPGDRVASYEYDANGQVTAVVSPIGLRLETTYDEVGRVTSTRSPAGVVTRFDYDANGALVSAQRGDDGAITFDVDSLVTNGATDAGGGTATVDYDGRYNLIRWVDQNGNVSEAAYDLSDRVAATSDPLGRTTVVAYDERGRVSGVADPSGRTFAPHYDPGGRLTAMVFDDGSSQRIGYDNLNRVRRVTDVDPRGHDVASVSYRYDAAGNLVEVVDGAGTVTYEVDPVGHQTAITYPDGSRVDYAYDELGRMTAATHSEHGATHYRWDDDSRLVAVARPDGSKRRYTYDGEQLIGLSEGSDSWRLRYDSSGRLAAVTGSDRWSFRYDRAGQLVEATQGSTNWQYSYDAVGNLTEVTERPVHKGKIKKPRQRPNVFDHDGANQLTTATIDRADSTFLHDGAGRLVAEVKGNGDRVDYEYDVRGRLSSVVITDAKGQGKSKGKGKGNGPTIDRWDRTYTPDGLLATVTHITTVARKSTTEEGWELTWDRSRPVPVPLGWTATGDTGPTTVVHGVGPALTADPKGRVSPIEVNPLGDIVGSAAAVSSAYDPFGSSGTDDGFGLGYRGSLHVGPTIHLGARDLEPRLGRFLTTDPLPRPLGATVTSAYAYAANDPINLIDPLGLAPTDGQIRNGGSTTGGPGQNDGWLGLPSLDQIRNTTWSDLGNALRHDIGAAITSVRDDPVGWAALGLVTVAATAAVVVTSPAWVTAAGVSALIGIGVTAAVGIARNQFDPMTAAINGVVAGATAGYGAAAGGLTVARAMAIEAVGSGIGDVAHQLITTDATLSTLDGASVAINAGIGAVTAGIFDGLGRTITRTTPNDPLTTATPNTNPTTGSGTVAPNTLVPGPNGAMRDTATGRFAPNPDRPASTPSTTSVHGNSRQSDQLTSLYQLYDMDGTYLKTGITADPTGRYPASFMEDHYMDIINTGSRSNMLDLERMIVEVDPGPLNFEPWAGIGR